MADQKPLNRAQLARFLPDHDAIRRFEKLSSIVEQLAPDVVNELNIAVANADAKAVLAIGLALSNDILYSPQFIQDRVAEKSNRVLTWLSM